MGSVACLVLPGGAFEKVPSQRGAINIMKWVKPEFEDISLCMEVTAYVNVAGK
ncbi:pyrroloquinoline quinone precursor peptide PqqA [Methylacidimicrobium sp. B4]|uniref:pyrroloquinoline quinone precursor peptide PqqA n=1 Tax=Methylacidimicrobium sp. B4 TaxID=2796139 RepID=UPI001A904EE3|nr:pyrroloquinoline quinone precursor peptide PqqA [Methylacidimicrobium sp. B4]QSR85181.1 pyrroloquinoline quinone precursor peptide PqqA [Methylacidimicrobium sp. B4]